MISDRGTRFRKETKTQTEITGSLLTYWYMYYNCLEILSKGDACILTNVDRWRTDCLFYM